jgi:hypothetical protein
LNTKTAAPNLKRLLSPRDDLHFVRTFAPNRLMPVEVPLDMRGVAVAAMGVVTVGIAQFFPHLVGRNKLEIIAAGAGLTEMSGAAYGTDAMRHWLQVDEIDFQFCGLGVESARETLKNDQFVSAGLFGWDTMHCMLAHLMWMRRDQQMPLPDLITLLHPGIEYSRECWLNDEGLREAAENGVPILLAAFAEQEMLLDRMALEAYGYKLSDPFQNKGAPMGNPEKSTDENPRCGAWLYAITGVDADRWRRPDKKQVARAFTRSSELLFEEGDTRREWIVNMLKAGHRGGNAFARMEDGVRLKNASRGNGHPLTFCRFQLQSVLFGQLDQNDYCAGQLMRYGAGLGEKFVMPYVAANPAALEARDEEGQTLVFHAIEQGDDTGLANTDLLEKVFKIANLSVVDDQALTPLQIAVQRNNSRAVDLLLKAGAPIVSPPGARDMVEFLVDHGAWRLLQILMNRDQAEAKRAVVNPVLVTRMQNAKAPVRLVERFRAWEHELGNAQTTGSVPIKQRTEDDGFAFSAAAAVKLMLVGHSVLSWSYTLDAGDPVNFLEVELAAELGDPELHRAIRAAEDTGEKLHGAVIALYGAIFQLLVGLAKFEDHRGETLGASIHRREIQRSLSVLPEFYEQMSSVIADDGVDPDKTFSRQALEAHAKRHLARYAAAAGKCLDSAATEKVRRPSRKRASGRV